MQDSVVANLVNPDTARTITPELSALEAAKIMATEELDALPVLRGGKLVGLVNERDLARRLLAAGRDPEKTPVSQIMTPDIDLLSATDSVRWAFELMRIRGYGQLPVTDADGNLVGVLTLYDLVRAFGERLDQEQKEQEQQLFGPSHGSEDSR